MASIMGKKADVQHETTRVALGAVSVKDIKNALQEGNCVSHAHFGTASDWHERRVASAARGDDKKIDASGRQFVEDNLHGSLRAFNDTRPRNLPLALRFQPHAFVFAPVHNRDRLAIDQQFLSRDNLLAVPPVLSADGPDGRADGRKHYLQKC